MLALKIVRTLHFWRNLSRSVLADRRGAISFTVGLMATAILGVSGLTIDAGDWYMTRRAMQEAADAAAIGAATEIYANGTQAQAVSAGTTDAQLNGFTTGNGITVNVSVSADTATATISKPATLLFSALFLANAPTITVTAQASVVPGGAPLCILATNGTASGAFAHNGSGSLIGNQCGVVVDSTSSTATIVNGSGTIQTEGLCGPGSYSISSSASVNPLPTSCQSESDPLYPLPTNLAPTNVNAACDYNNSSYNKSTTISPGVYCGGITLTGSATVTFQPGVYILRDGPLQAQGSSVINATGGVAFYLSGATGVHVAEDAVTFSGNASVNITAPSTGPLAGIAFYQDHSAATGSITNTINGSVAANIDGVLYFGNQNIVINGSSNTSDEYPYTGVIGNTVTFNGSNTFTIGVRSVPLPSVMTMPRVALTE